MPATSNRGILVPWLLGLILLTVMLLPVLDGRLFADDWQFVRGDPRPHVLGAFTELHPYDLYRPIQWSTFSLFQSLFGSTTIPIHLLNVALHAALMLTVAAAARDLDCPPAGLPFLLAFLACSQLNAFAVGSNDTLSLVLATWMGVAATWFAWRTLTGRSRNAALPIVLYALALLAKESGLGYLPAILALILLVERSRRDRLGLRIVLTVGLLAVTAGYLLLRAHLGAAFLNSRAFSPTVLVRNAAMVWFAAVSPVRTLDLHTWVVQRDLVPVAGVLAALLAGLIAVAGGLRRCGTARMALILLTLGTMTVLPILGLRHVSELYGYSLLPAAALIVGLATGCQTGVRRNLAVVATLAWCIVQSAGLHANAVDMAANGERAGRAMDQLVGRLKTVPHGATVCLTGESEGRPDYSVYRMSTDRIAPLEEAIRIAGREDLKACEPGNVLHSEMIHFHATRAGDVSLTSTP